MADIRINGLPAEASPVATDVLPIDGASTRKTTIQAAVEIGRPAASQAEAEAGVNATKVMTPLTVKQSIASEVGVSIASAAQGNLADGSAQKAQNLNDLLSKPDARLNIAVPVYTTNRTALKALDTTKDVVAYLREGGREGVFKWTTGNFSTQIAADPQEGVYIKADAIAATAGAWVRNGGDINALDARWFGAVADSTGVGFGTDSLTGLQAAINLSIVAGFDFVPVGRYRSTGTLTYNRTTLNSNFGRIPSIRGAGAAGMSGIFFDAGVAIGLDIQGSMASGVFGGFFRIENLSLWTSGKTGDGLKIKDGAFIQVSQVRCRGWNNGILLQNVISSRFSPVFCDGNVAGVLAENGPTALPCNALTFENCWINGNDRIGIEATNVTTLNVLGGSVEGNGVVTFGSSPTTSGGIRVVNCGQGGHVGLVSEGVYYEHNAGLGDIMIINDAALSSVSKMCSHLAHGNTYNRVHATEFTTNNIYISSTNVPQKVSLSGNGHGNLGTSAYTENSARKYVVVNDPNNVITLEDDGSNMYTSSVAAPDFSNTYVRGSFLEAEACGYVASDGTLQAGAKNVASVAKVATGRYQITLRRSWAGRKGCFAVADARRTAYVQTIDNNSVTIELQDGTTPSDMSFNFVIFKPFY